MSRCWLCVQSQNLSLYKAYLSSTGHFPSLSADSAKSSKFERFLIVRVGLFWGCWEAGAIFIIRFLVSKQRWVNSMKLSNGWIWERGTWKYKRWLFDICSISGWCWLIVNLFILFTTLFFQFLKLFIDRLKVLKSNWVPLIARSVSPSQQYQVLLVKSIARYLSVFCFNCPGFALCMNTSSCFCVCVLTVMHLGNYALAHLFLNPLTASP